MRYLEFTAYNILVCICICVQCCSNITLKLNYVFDINLKQKLLAYELESSTLLLDVSNNTSDKSWISGQDNNGLRRLKDYIRR